MSTQHYVSASIQKKTYLRDVSSAQTSTVFVLLADFAASS